MKQIFLGIVLTLFTQGLKAQTPRDQKFPKSALESDLLFIRAQLFNAHANPFTELDSLHFEARFQQAKLALKDSMTAFELLKLAKPLFAPLSDEHARIGMNLDKSELQNAKILLPFNLQKSGAFYVIKTLLSTDTGLNVGDTIRSIEGEPISAVLQTCADYTTGFPEQRLAKSMQQLGLTYLYAYPNKTSYQIETNHKKWTIKGLDFAPWKNYLIQGKGKSSCKDLISYTSFDKVGYVNYCSFSVGSDSAFQQLDLKLKQIFKQIKKEKIETLIIDVSNNSGGNSACGNMIINYFHAKPYLGYQCKWKRSDEYLALTKSWGAANEFYQSRPLGSVISFESSRIKPSRHLKNRFKGKVFVVVGPQTFSSAIMFATMVKDNDLATLVGQTPDNGHPNHFGEMYGSKTPNTNLELQFGVKEWIRPSGERGDNQLRPDKVIDLHSVKDVPDLIARILR